MKVNYELGRGNWLESIAVGIIGSIAIVIATPVLLMASIFVFVAGICGFLKRKE